MHTTIATNGTTMTPKLAGELRQAGLRYVEISLDAVDPARHQRRTASCHETRTKIVCDYRSGSLSS